MALCSLSEGRKKNPSTECTLISGRNLKHKVSEEILQTEECLDSDKKEI